VALANKSVHPENRLIDSMTEEAGLGPNGFQWTKGFVA
jgi:hypothetical protein